MATLEETLRALRERGRVGLIPYFPVGFPHADSTVALASAAAAAGADAIELGIPFSDPLADGSTIQRATTRALQNGITLAACLDAARAVRRAGVTIPLLFMGYYNPFLRYGLTRFARDAAAAGIDGCIVPDLPPEEAGDLRAALDAVGIALVAMVAPTSTEERLRLAARTARGFLYCVSVTGVTGARRDLPPDLPAFLARVRAVTDLPIAVGFGISTPEHVEQVGRLADLAIVGSAVVDRIDRPTTAEAAQALADYLRDLRALAPAR
ncbi:MAG: tryptophan synthase subunit alpha [Chloroflexota bacterium]|nr:tryptophan synthase subunit alpha [Dehalococcoidia bacterium]MDW8252348.1 tryptophan synthase subunit alpha [Chloroflexota bacterium]